MTVYNFNAWSIINSRNSMNFEIIVLFVIVIPHELFTEIIRGYFKFHSAYSPVLRLELIE